MPAFFAWLSKRYPKILKKAKEEKVPPPPLLSGGRTQLPPLVIYLLSHLQSMYICHVEALYRMRQGHFASSPLYSHWSSPPRRSHPTSFFVLACPFYAVRSRG